MTNAETLKTLCLMSWRMGDVRYKLKPAQLKMFEDIYLSDSIKYVIKCSRRLGKTYLLCSISVMQCLKKPGTMVRYAAPTNKALKKFIIPVMSKIFEDAPNELRPEFKESQQYYVFPNGSQVHLAGVNNDNADSLRGTFADLFIIDEAGFVDDLKYLIDDVAMPQFLDPDGNIVKGRRLIISGSPSRTPSHEFTEIARKAELEGSYSHFNIYAGGYSEETLEIFKKEVGGEKSTTWQREYLALDVVDETAALIPEWRDENILETNTNDLFQYWHKYVSLDIGVRDLTVALFGYYDFQKACLFIMDEVSMNGPEMTTDRLASAVRDKEKELFNVMKIHKRVSDVDLLLLNDLRAIHNLYFIPTDKGRLEEMVNEVRIWVNTNKVKVSPKCEQLLGCLKFGVWNHSRTEFDRSHKYGHFDALASLLYMIRNIDTKINPVPMSYNKPIADYFFEDVKSSGNKSVLKKMFGVRNG